MTRAPAASRIGSSPWRSGRWRSTCSGLSSTGARASPTRSGRAGCRAIPTSWPTRGAPATGRSSPRSTTARGRGADFDDLHLVTLDDLLAERGVELAGRGAARARGRVAPAGPVARRPRRASRRCAGERAGGDALQRPRRAARRPRAPRRPALRRRALGRAGAAPTSRRRRCTTPRRGCSASSPAELMLVAAHPWDLEGARKPGCGRRSSTGRWSTGRARLPARIRTPTSRSPTCSSWRSGWPAERSAVWPVPHTARAGRVMLLRWSSAWCWPA